LAALKISNNAINNIKLMDIKDKLARYNGTMKQNSYRLIRLINNLIDITKIDSGFFNLKLSNVNIVSIVEEITLSVASFIESRNIELVFDTDIEERITACDPDKLERIIFNILSNAIKFTDAGGKITVSIIDGVESIGISIQDTGIGISEENQKKIFERFLQVDDSLSRNHEGCGIGLSLVKSFVEMHGGEVTVASTYGKGSNFFIKLPIRIAANSEEKNIQDAEISQYHAERMQIEFSDIYA
ncbi:MAG: HAMP domain-containing histidine kinase, partial [Ruminiclostridium sp.]|nr:HAMP domain-containing histidine kinase [Ruminiclostridium sp.]